MILKEVSRKASIPKGYPRATEGFGQGHLALQCTANHPVSPALGPPPAGQPARTRANTRCRAAVGVGAPPAASGSIRRSSYIPGSRPSGPPGPPPLASPEGRVATANGVDVWGSFKEGRTA